MLSIFVTSCDKRVPKCQCDHPELLIPTQSATRELWGTFQNCAQRQSEMMATENCRSRVATLRNGSWKDVHCFQKKRKVQALVILRRGKKKVIYGSKMVVSSSEYDRIDALQCEQRRFCLFVKHDHGVVFSSNLMISPATLSPFCQGNRTSAVGTHGQRYSMCFSPPLRVISGRTKM